MCLSRLTVLSCVVFAGALRYVGYGAGHDVRVTLCGLRCAGLGGSPTHLALVYQTLAYVAYDVNHLNIEWWSIGSGRGLLC